MKSINDLTAEYVRSILEYDPETGVFKRKWRRDISKKINTRCVGKLAGSYNEKGYLRISINDRRYYAHRLAWLIVYGEWPDDDIDHIDGDPNNNRIENLRIATRQENLRNSRLQKNNTTGITGVCWRKDVGKFVARIKIDGNYIHLGYFDTLAEAAAARHAAEIEHFGEFRRAA